AGWAACPGGGPGGEGGGARARKHNPAGGRTAPARPQPRRRGPAPDEGGGAAWRLAGAHPGRRCLSYPPRQTGTHDPGAYDVSARTAPTTASPSSRGSSCTTTSRPTPHTGQGRGSGVAADRATTPSPTPPPPTAPPPRP